MISNFKYLSQIAEAYQSQILEAFPKDVEKLLKKEFAPVYKQDGYDQFGIDVNGKDRKGHPVIWRYPDRWVGDANKLRKLLAAAAQKEKAFTGGVKHNYDRYGLDVLGFDKNGFDIQDKDILGQSGDDFGTEEYTAKQPERDRARHNLFAKNTMRDVNFKKKHPLFDENDEMKVLKSYKEALNQENPEQYFKAKLRMIFMKQKPNGNIDFDRQAVNYFLQKYPFVEDKSTTVSKEEFVQKFQDTLIEQLNKSFRPESFEQYFDFEVEDIGDERDDEEGDNEVTTIIYHLYFKPEVVDSKPKRREIGSKVKNAINRIDKILPFTNHQCHIHETPSGTSVILQVFDEYMVDMTNSNNVHNAIDNFEAEHQRGIYSPDFAKTFQQGKNKAMLNRR